MSHIFNPVILREYDVRGTYGQTLNGEDAYAIGLKFSAWLRHTGGSQVVVGRDGRLSSPDLLDKLIKGLIEGGMTVTDVGVGPTPLVYYSLKYLKTDAAIMVTGSHNPPQDNGFKFALQQGPFFGSDIQAMAAITEQSETAPPKQGGYSEKTTSESYIDRLLTDYEAVSLKKLRIAWDSGNGACGAILEKLVQHIDADHFLLNTDIDGLFPAHHPDPTDPKNMQQLAETVQNNSCDLGIAFDGDGDRIGVIDSFGRLIWGDQLLTILALDILKNNPNATIITDVKAGQGVYDEVTKAGGHLIMWKTGHSLIKKHMAKTNALLAGEMSGHIFYADTYYGYDDGLYAAIRLINILQRSPYSLSELLEQLPSYHNTPELQFPCPDDLKFNIIDQLAEALKEAGLSFIDIDGVRVHHELGWWLVRASNTQAKLVARCEAKTPQGLILVQNQMTEFLAPLLPA